MDAAPNATVESSEHHPEGLQTLRVRPDGGVPPSFEPGQFTSLGLLLEGGDGPHLVQRAYSVASAPGRLPVEFFIRHVEEGLLTPHLWRLEHGDRLHLSSRYLGRFTLDDVPRDAHVLAIATGTGIAPYLSMLRAFAGRGRWRRFALVHGMRLASERVQAIELAALAAAHPDVRYLPACTREPDDSAWDGLRGRVGDLVASPEFPDLAGFPVDPAACHVLLCGNPHMIEDQERAFEARGFAVHRPRRPGNLHIEKYWAG